ncbi:Choline-sulfatase [Penicillium waksmanii]|uniref:Choline-sulfatase n=1 Tax=Penicillium waksmanii TaxID=69791 RepID=UPI002548B6C3|nr:Choline-sulfatase [Penicillium waksmanii]KAJ6000265.1 Choline-sulfatase [Penicillium waksmanii]
MDNQGYWDIYKNINIPLPKNSTIPHNQLDAHCQQILRHINLFSTDLPKDHIETARYTYYALYTYVNTNSSKVLKVLKNTGLDEDTIIVFTGDHGDILGERGLWYKMAWFENSSRVPMLFHAPKKFTPKRVSDLYG